MDNNAQDLLQTQARPLRGGREDYDALLEFAGTRRFVLIGEATHGTHEFYQERAEITQRLIREKGFTAVAVEADWPDAYRVNRYVRALSDDVDAEESLSDFKRFPGWMWRNAEVLNFIGWLREWNDHHPNDRRKVGFYGLDLYSLHTSIEQVLAYLKKVDPEGARRARARYSCFDHFGEDTQAYAYASSRGGEESCEEEVIGQLLEIRRRASEYRNRDGHVAADEYFFAEQNARLIKNAEQYYRSMLRDHELCWNLRDRHMTETLDALVTHLTHEAGPQKVVVWAHNSHLGDARATEMSRRGEFNLGQLARERYGNDAALIGMTTWAGTVIAASEWDGPAQRKRVRPALPGSFEALFHESGLGNFYLEFQEKAELAAALKSKKLERAIGVIYLPETERYSHYFDASLSSQFDAVLHFDETRAVEPLERRTVWRQGEVPETFPSSL